MGRTAVGIAAFGVLLILSMLSPHIINAQEFTPETLSHVSRAIADTKLLNDQPPEMQAPSAVYLTSTVAGLAERLYGREPLDGGVLGFTGHTRISQRDQQWSLYKLRRQGVTQLQEQRWHLSRMRAQQ